MAEWWRNDGQNGRMAGMAVAILADGMAEWLSNGGMAGMALEWQNGLIDIKKPSLNISLDLLMFNSLTSMDGPIHPIFLGLYKNIIFFLQFWSDQLSKDSKNYLSF